MSKRLTPFFSMDGEGSAPSEPTSWMEDLQSIDYSAADDEQTDDSDSDAEVETDTDEGNEQEQEQEVEETPAVDEDPDIEMGEGRQPIKLSELKNGYQRQSDYTKKTQELAAQRKEVEAQAEKLKPVSDWLTHIESNPWLWQQINAAIEQFNTTEAFPIDEVLQDAQYGKYVNHLMAENTRLKSELERVNGEYEGVKLTGEMNTLRSELTAEYGELVTDEYMQQLQERGKTEKLSTSTLKEIADGHLAKKAMQASKQDVKKATKQAEAKAAQKLAETRQKAPEVPKAPSAAPKGDSIDYSNMSWEETLRAAVGRK